MKTTFKNEFQSVISTVEVLPEVKETLFTNKGQGSHKTFNTADLWNIQRQTKYRTQRRFI
jgi:hypothetical protein